MAPPVIIYKNTKNEDPFAEKKSMFHVFQRNLNRKYLNPEKHTVKPTEPLNQNEKLEEVLRKTKKGQIEVSKNLRKKEHGKIFFPDFWSFEHKRNLLAPTDMLKIQKHIDKEIKSKKYQTKKNENNFEIKLKTDEILDMQISEIYGLRKFASPTTLASPRNQYVKTDHEEISPLPEQKQQHQHRRGQTQDFGSPTAEDEIPDDYQLIGSLTQRSFTPHKRSSITHRGSVDLRLVSETTNNQLHQDSHMK